MYSFFMIAKITTFPVTSKYKWENKIVSITEKAPSLSEQRLLI